MNYFIKSFIVLICLRFALDVKPAKRHVIRAEQRGFLHGIMSSDAAWSVAKAFFNLMRATNGHLNLRQSSTWQNMDL